MSIGCIPVIQLLTTRISPALLSSVSVKFQVGLRSRSGLLGFVSIPNLAKPV